MSSLDDKVQPRIEDIAAPVTELLARTEVFLYETLESDSGYIEQLCGHIERFKGKRVRPTLVHLCARAAGGGGDDAESVRVEVAAVIELIHLTTLVHDDIIDEARMRRRVPTVNAEWGNETAVILGDYLFASAFKVLTSMRDLRPLAILSAATKLMCEGELLQIGHRGDAQIAERQYLDVIGRKTAELFRASGYLGSLLAGADAECAEAMGRCAYGIGVAFQIIDDCLDLVGTEQQMGKSLGSDIEKGHLTLPVIHWISQTPAEQRRQAVAELGLLDGPVDRRKVASQLEASGSIRYANDRAQEEVARAVKELARLPDSHARECLRMLGDYVITRSV